MTDYRTHLRAPSDTERRIMRYEPDGHYEYTHHEGFLCKGSYWHAGGNTLIAHTETAVDPEPLLFSVSDHLLSPEDIVSLLQSEDERYLGEMRMKGK